MTGRHAYAREPARVKRAFYPFPAKCEAKTAGNYAASLYAGEEAHKNGYSQVLWLDGVEQKYVEEVGSMNIFFVIDYELITPMLSGSILPGITRDSIITLAKSWDINVSERKISIDEVLEAHDSGRQ